MNFIDSALISSCQEFNNLALHHFFRYDYRDFWMEKCTTVRYLKGTECGDHDLNIISLLTTFHTLLLEPIQKNPL